MPFDPLSTYVQLQSSGVATAVPGGDAFWLLPPQEVEAAGSGWLISEYEFAADWPTWEMHPDGDEFVYLLSGCADLLLDEPGGVRTLQLRGSAAVIVPRGIWHTAKIHEPSRMLHVTLGAGTQTRPA
ncbi:cupin [Caenimonas sp. SL110]|uniref:cupin domain-containing protein n=1 Tax=Caenimonas sp. SL110 TaxID=1450524 RepID=UPI000653FB95|nr:cupin [Caenimonas sp. SL110]